MYSVLVLGALASSALGQAISFSNTTFTAPVTVGTVWPISFGGGDGSPVALVFGNTTYAFQIVDGLTAPGTYNWGVAVPVDVVAGTYQVALRQGTAAPVFSPAFSLVIPPEQISSTTDAPTTSLSFPAGAVSTATTTTTVTAIYLASPTGGPLLAVNGTSNAVVTWIYYEEECGCHLTSSCAASELPATPLPITTVTYSQAECGCTTTIEAPYAETVIPVASVAAPAPAPAPATTTAPVATNVPVAPAATLTTPPVPSYTGAASRFAVASWAFLGTLAALALA